MARARCLLVMAGACVLGLAAVAVVCLIEMRQRSRTRVCTRYMIGLAYDVASAAVRGSTRPLALPRGDVRALRAWLESQGAAERALAYQPRGEVLVDEWGRPLVYRFPSKRTEGIFDLYSVGPNGVDEMGQGDDIFPSRVASFPEWATEFRGGVVDVEWVRAHLDELKRDGDGKIIGAPPEKLKDVE